MSASLVTGNMIGSGIFLLPAALAVFGGISLLGWLYTAIGATFLALVFSRLGRLLPRAGGPYTYTREAFGDFPGFLVAWGYWVSIWCGNAAIAVAFAGYLAVFFPIISSSPLVSGIVAFTAIWSLTWVNSIGVRSAGFVQLVTTILKLTPIGAIAILGVFYLNPDHFIPFNLSTSSSFSAVTKTAALTLWAFMGLESATIPADHIDNPKKTIPRATLIGTLATAVVYILGTTAVMGIVPPAALSKSTAPFADAADVIWGTWVRYIVAAGAAISCFGALNGWIILQGQIPRSAAADGLLPKHFGLLSRRGTPVFAIIFSSILITLLIAMNYTRGLVDAFTFIILLSTMTCLVPYIFCSFAEIVIRLKHRDRHQTQMIPKIAMLSIPAFLYSVWAITGLGKTTILWGFLLLAGGVPIYVLMKKSTKIHPC